MSLRQHLPNSRMDNVRRCNQLRVTVAIGKSAAQLEVLLQRAAAPGAFLPPEQCEAPHEQPIALLRLDIARSPVGAQARP